MSNYQINHPFHTHTIQRATTETNTDMDTAEGSANSDIDLQALARKIYTLLRHELQLERERIGYRQP